MSLLRFLAKSLSNGFCTRHPDVEAVATCASCLAPVCEVCAIPAARGLVRCPSCVRKRRHAAWWIGGAAVLFVAGAVAGIVAYRRREVAPPPVAIAAPKDPLEEALDREPCDRGKIYELASKLMRVGESRAAIQRADAFFGRCGDEPRLRGLMVTAHMYLSDWDGAAAEATHLLETDPNDARYWSWRGIARESKGDLAPAADDFRQALALDPKLGGVPFNLARIYERRGTPCDGIGPVEQFLHYNPTARDARSEALLARLYATEGCSGMAGSGRAVIHFVPAAKVIQAVVQINSRPGTFVVDTGASSVVLSSTFAKAAGIDSSGWPSIRLATAGGLRTAKLGVLDEVEVQGVKASRVEGVVCDDLGSAQGLLGESFLSRFDVRIDPAKGVLEISARPSTRKAGSSP